MNEFTDAAPGIGQAGGGVQNATQGTGDCMIGRRRLAALRFDAAFSEILSERPDAPLTVADFMITANRERIADFALRHGLPSGAEFKECVTAGGLFSYGPSIKAVVRRCAYYVARILKGANPAELPVEQPTVLDLAVNLKTAKALGLTLPEAVVIGATDVIDRGRSA